ncbi:Putative receptor-like protein kinase At3g47110 [Linum perenne]
MVTGDPLGALSSWNDSVHFCEWYGVSCSKRHHGRVTVLNLSSHGLYGSISPHVGNLSFLKFLCLYNNNFIGEIPPEISHLHRLQRLSLHNNLLDGEIPSNISRCFNLIIFDVCHNKLVGRLPWKFSQLNKLQYLNVRSNNLSGSIPLAFGNLSSLLEFDGGENQLSERVPNTLGRLKSLTGLYLNFNNLSGEIPASIFNLTSLTKILHLYNNKLSGYIPSTIGNLTKLIELSMSNNYLSGEIPASIQNCQKILKIELAHNNLSGVIPLTLFKATDGFSSANQIGVGSFGLVYKGVLNEIGGASINIGVKVFKLQRHGAFKSFMAECEALKNIRHKNLVRIVTVCSSVDYEGSLEDWLHQPVERIDESTTTRSLNFSQRLNVAIDIASAVHYLHNYCGTPIVHCDLKPSNVLLDEDMVAHVGDFGLARFLSTVANPSSSNLLFFLIFSCEEYGMGNEVSIQGDIYSYGILQLELFTGRRPTDETFKDGLSLHNVVKSAMSKQRTYEVVDPVLLDELLRKLTTHHSSSEEARKDLEELMSSILEIGVACSSDIPEARVSMSEVLSKSYRH